VAVHKDGQHRFSKVAEEEITLVADFGVVGDAHAGATVQHRSRIARDPARPNLRQVHLIHGELHDELRSAGFEVTPGQLGENITTRGLDLLGLPQGTLLQIGASVVLEVTGLRNPCQQIDAFQSGLLAAVLGRDERGNVIRKTGIMTVVRRGGRVRAGDVIAATIPDGPPQPLKVV